MTLRGIFFEVVFFAWSAFLVILAIPTLWLPQRYLLRAQRFWAASSGFLIRLLLGAKITVRGRAQRPKAPAIYAFKHQSIFDTIFLHGEFAHPAIVMKDDLLKVPVYGRMGLKSGMIPVARAGYASALRDMVKRAQHAAQDGRPVVIFPQGTRVAPGEEGAEDAYHPGVAALYRGLNCPVVPVALNTGMVWPRQHFRQRPGHIIIEYLPAIEPGLDRKAFMARLKDETETACRRIEAEARE